MRTIEMANSCVVFPTALPEIPDVIVGPRFVYDCGREAFFEIPQRSGLISRRPHPDLYLRAAGLDVENPQAVLAFINREGPLRLDPGVGMEYGFFPAWPDFKNARYEPFGLAKFGDEWDHRLAEARERLRGVSPPPSPLTLVFGVDTVEGSSQAVRTLRRMVACYATLTGMETGVQVENAADPEDAAYELTSLLNDVLSAFTPHVSLLLEDMPAEVQARLASPPLYCVLALQLAHHIANKVQYRLCADDYCREPFTVQEGRSQHGQYRKDSKYCCPACAQRVATRNYRQRKRSIPPSRRDTQSTVARDPNKL